MNRLSGLFSALKLMLFLGLALALQACESDGRKRVNRESLRFATTDDAEIFFRNLRRIEYDHQELAAAKLDIFRHKSRNQEASYPLLTPALVINWRYDEAYLVLEANEPLGEERPLVVAWRDSVRQLSGQHILENNNKMEQLRFASQLYESLQQGRKLYVQKGEQLQPLLHLPEDRKVFRTTLLDYYRLTRTIK